MNWKKKIIPITLILMLLIPTVAFANNESSNEENVGRFPLKFARDEGFRRILCTPDCQLPEEFKAKMEELKNQFENGQITRDEFIEERKLLMPEKFQFKDKSQWHLKKREISEELKSKLGELQEKLKNGEMTREQFLEEMKQLKPEKFHLRQRKYRFDNKEEVPEELKAKMEELRDKLKNGEITREQLREELKQFKK